MEFSAIRYTYLILSLKAQNEKFQIIITTQIHYTCGKEGKEELSSSMAGIWEKGAN